MKIFRLRSTPALSAPLLVTLLVCVFASANAAERKPRPALVKLADAVAIKMAPQIQVAGNVVSRHDARIAAEVPGRLVSVAEVGDSVTEGEMLAQIDDQALGLQRAESKAVESREQARHRFAKQEYQRLKGLSEKGLVTSNRLDQARAESDAAASAWLVARAATARINDQLTRTVVSAPFNGVVIERFQTPGERVAAGDSVVRLVDAHALEVQAFVPATSLPFITRSQTLTAKRGSSEHVLKVRLIVPVGDKISRLHEIRLASETLTWPAGTAVRVAVPTDAVREVVAVPRDALVLRRTGISVFKLSAEQRSQQVPVETGIASGPMIEVIGDISPGDQVIVRGAERLRPGQAVTIMPAANTRPRATHRQAVDQGMQ